MKILKKSVATIALLGLCVAIASGCTKNEIKSPEDTSTAGTTTASASTDASAGTTDEQTPENTADASDKVIKEGTIQKDGNVILKELAFVINGKTIGISDIVDDEKLESILGKADESKAHTYSSDDGLNMDTLLGFTEKQYKYSGLDIKTINGAEGRKFYIFNVKITDAKYPTIRNIKVGDSVEALKEAYPEGNMLGGGEKEDDFQYLPVNYVDGMKFHIKNNKVESILMYKLLD